MQQEALQIRSPLEAHWDSLKAEDDQEKVTKHSPSPQEASAVSAEPRGPLFSQLLSLTHGFTIRIIRSILFISIVHCSMLFATSIYMNAPCRCTLETDTSLYYWCYSYCMFYWAAFIGIWEGVTSMQSCMHTQTHMYTHNREYYAGTSYYYRRLVGCASFTVGQTLPHNRHTKAYAMQDKLT